MAYGTKFEITHNNVSEVQNVIASLCRKHRVEGCRITSSILCVLWFGICVPSYMHVSVMSTLFFFSH